MNAEDIKNDSIVFQPGRIGNLEVKNRLIRSATFENMATRLGEITEDLLDLYRNLVHGEVGLIITGHVGIHLRSSVLWRYASVVRMCEWPIKA